MTSANTPPTENEMLEEVQNWLRARLPDTWEVARSGRIDTPASPSTAATAIDLRSPNGTYSTIVIEARQTLQPREVASLLGSSGRTFQTISNIPILVVAPWLSERTQTLLEEAGYNYIDLSGNALVRLENPTLFLQTEGASKDPWPSPRGKPRITGPKAGRLVRLLIDVTPPYGVRELADAAGLAPGYVSRLLSALDDEALIDRSTQGRVETVNVRLLLERWAEVYDIFSTNTAHRYLAPPGAAATIPRFGSITASIAVTGSFAAVRLAPVAGPALAIAYADNHEDAAIELGLMATDQGPNVVLLSPADPVVWDRTEQEDGVTYVAPSQVAVDCLTGNGRMPAEGEALLDWLTSDESVWRRADLAGINQSP